MHDKKNNQWHKYNWTLCESFKSSFKLKRYLENFFYIFNYSKIFKVTSKDKGGALTKNRGMFLPNVFLLLQTIKGLFFIVNFPSLCEKKENKAKKLFLKEVLK